MLRLKRFFILLSIILLVGFGWNNLIQKSEFKSISIAEVFTDSIIEIKTGDILARPNWAWLPGSCYVPNGRKYGHVAMVAKGGKGKTMEEALENSTVVEALFFDQKTREFQFKKENQIREAKAIISFGSKFKGIRYWLRTELDSTQQTQVCNFLRSQLDGGYDILSMKKIRQKKNINLTAKFGEKAFNWHCATLIWEAYYLATDVDLDANGSMFVYPSDIICSPEFDRPASRIVF